MRAPFYNWLLDELAARFGEAVCERLVVRAGGTSLYVPYQPTPRLVELIGRDAAAWLCEERGGETVAVASRRSVEGRRAREARDAEIRSTPGSVSTLALRFGLSGRHVRSILNRARTGSSGAPNTRG